MNKILGILSICKKAGKISAGADVTYEALEDYKARLVVFSGDASTKTTRRFMEMCKVRGVPYVKIEDDKEALGLAVSKSMCSVCAVLDLGLANSIAKHLKPEEKDNVLVQDKLELKIKRKQERLENQKDPNYVKREVVKTTEIIEIEENAYNKRNRRTERKNKPYAKNTHVKNNHVKKTYGNQKPKKTDKNMEV